MTPPVLNSPGTIQLGYIIKMFPRLSETFILNEVLELEAQGVALNIFSLKRPVDNVTHGEASKVKASVMYLREKIGESIWELCRAHLRTWQSFPRAWRRQIRNTWRRSRTDDFLALSQACSIVSYGGRLTHFHAHYANVPAKVALLVQRLTGATYSITTHAKDIFQNDPFASSKLCERMCRASFLVANSRFSATHIQKHLPSSADVRVVYNGLDLSRFPLRQERPVRPLVLGVGRLVEKKGFGDFVRMCAHLKEQGVRFESRIVGTGVLSGVLKEQIGSMRVSDRVSLAGPMPHESLVRLYEQASVFVLPCKQAADGDRDILPNVVKEAMAVGVPVVTTRLDGIEELIEDGVSGLLVEPGDSAALAQKVGQILADPIMAGRLTKNARQVIETKFDRIKNFAGLRAAFEECVRPAQLAVASSETVLTQSSYGTSCVH